MANQPDSNPSRPATDSRTKVTDKTSISTPGQQTPAVVPPAKKKPLQTVAPQPNTGKKTNRRLPGKAVSPLSIPRLETEPIQSADVTVTDRIYRHRKQLSSWLTSTILHVTLIIALALVITFQPVKDSALSIIAEVVTEPVPEKSEIDTEKIEIIAPKENESPIEMTEEDISVEIEKLAPQTNDSLVQQPSPNENPTQAEEVVPDAPHQTLPTGGGLQGRDAEARSRLAGSRGGSRESEAAVENGLRWIIDHQHYDGSWHFKHQRGECNCKNPGTKETTTAATGLSLMALLGAGYTHEVGPYQVQINAGLEYLKKRMRKTKYGGNLAEGTMYAQAIATIALSEAYIMTRDEELKDFVEQAMTYIINAQGPRGGWRYNPGQPGDMTVTGWQLMALKSCQLGGFDVPRETFQKAKKFLDSKGESGGSYYGYLKPGMEKSPTAIGLLSQMYLGWDRERGALHTGADRLANWGPSKTDVYFNYYATQVLHHLNTPIWKEWNPPLRDYLVKTQETRGHQAGSWYFRDQHGKVGGRLYTTAMCVMILEVYYRYMPLYDDRAVD